MTLVVVTGASGFVGAALARTLVIQGFRVRGAYRSPPLRPPPGVEAFVTGELSAETDWRASLKGADVVVHAAGPAHAHFSDAQLQAAITEASAGLAREATRARVSRLVFISSIKASATATRGSPVSERDPPAPEDAYGRAKLAAEAEIVVHDTVRPVVLRPPLICAVDARANFARLLHLANAPVPLPLASLRAPRNVISRDSLIAAVMAVIQSHSGPPGVFHVTDQPSLSVAEMLTALRAGFARPSGLLAVPGIKMLLPGSLVRPLEVDDVCFRSSYGYGARTNVHSAEMLSSIAAAWKASR
jgi:nucleoside-diphosphate-sugar epimerase